MQNACSQPVNSCLANQLSDLATADDKRVAAGSTPQYYVSRWGGGRAGAKQASRCLVATFRRAWSLVVTRLDKHAQSCVHVYTA